MEQERGVQQVKEETRIEERPGALTDNGESSRKRGIGAIHEFGRRSANLVDGEVSEAEAAMKELQKGMLVVLEADDALRGTAAWKVLQILRPIQTVKFLEAVAQFHLTTLEGGVWSETNAYDSCDTPRPPYYSIFIVS